MKFNIGFIITLIMLMAVVFSSAVVNVYTPTPASTVTDNRSIEFKFMLDSDEVDCWYEIGLTNGSTLGNHSASTAYNLTGSARVWTSDSKTDVQIDSAVGSYHNWSIYCGATQTGATLIDSYTFKLRTVRPTITSPTSAGIYSYRTVPITGTTGIAISSTSICQYALGLTNGTTESWVDLTNTSTTQMSWANSSAIDFNIDSANAKSHNVTLRCNDSAFYSSETYLITVDTTKPVIQWLNMSVSGSVVTLNSTVTDNNPYSCSARVYDRDESLVTSLVGTQSGTGSTSYCVYTLTSSDVGSDGAFKIDYTATDTAGNTNTTDTNHTGILTTLYTGWNLMSYGDSSNTVAEICDMINGCTTVSTYNNTHGAKSFTTYSTSAPTVNNDTDVLAGTGIYLYVSADTYLMVDDAMPTTGSAENITITSDDWNIMGLTSNASIYTILNAVDFGTSNKNITWVSYYDGSGDTSYTCSRTNNLCSGMVTPATIEMPKGSAIWIDTAENITINRTALSG